MKKASLGTAYLCLFFLGKLLNVANATDREENIVVTANRIPVANSRVLAPVEVIDSETIERSLAIDLGELLRFQTGIEVVRSGGPGQQTSIFTRGTNSDHTLILIDGVRINNGSSGTAPIEHISPDMIERVEIVKGPRSSLYGEDAIGGVINIFTKSSVENHLSASVGLGQHDTQKFGLAAGAGIGEFDLRLQIQHLDTDGFPAIEGSDVDRGHDNTTINARARGNFDKWSIEGRVWNAEGNTEYFDFVKTPMDQDYNTLVLALTARAELASIWESRIDVSYVEDEVEQNQSTDFTETDRRVVDWQNELQFDEKHVLVAGAALVREEVSAISFGSPVNTDDRDINALFVEDNLAVGNHAVVVAARFSDDDAYGSDLTWNLEYGFDYSPEVRFTGGVGHAVRAPTAFDRYGFGGNPDINQEKSLSADVGLNWSIDSQQNLGVGIFYTEIDDLIVFDPNTFSLANLDKAEIPGLEVAYDYSGQNWTLRISGLLQDPENKTDGTTLLRRAKETFQATFVRDIGKHKVGFDFLAVGPRDDFAGEMSGYGTVNLTGQFIINENLSLHGRIENAFDREYTSAFFDSTTRYIPTERWAYVEFRYKTL